jgi:hypothetical protein
MVHFYNVTIQIKIIKRNDRDSKAATDRPKANRGWWKPGGYLQLKDHP